MSRIALLLPNLGGGGAERSILMLAREFSRRGYEVQLVVLDARGELRDLVPSGVSLIDLAADIGITSRIFYPVSSLIRLGFWLHNNQPAAVLSTVTGMNLIAILAHRFIRSRCLLVIREASTLDNVRGWLRILAMRWLYPKADVVVAVSPTVKRQVVNQLQVPASRVHHIPNGVDKKHIYQQSVTYIEHPWLSDQNIKVVAAVGRLSPAKDYPTLLHAFASIPKELNSRLLVIGEGPERPLLEALIRSLGLQTRVQLIGFDINPWRWVSRANLFVLTSKWEGHPNSLLEAIVLKRPCVVTAYDDSLKELSTTFGLLEVPPNDPVALVNAMRQQLMNPSYPRNLNRVLDIHAVTTEYLSLLRDTQKDPIRSC